MSPRGPEAPRRLHAARITVDGGALFGPADGIGRYVRSLLPRLISQAAQSWSWKVLGRRPASRVLAGLPNVQLRADGMPAGVGRVLSLASSQPWWLRREKPDLHWGPAHRLPFALPADTARVVTIHDLCWMQMPATMRRATRTLDARLMPRALREADRVIAVSDSTRRDLETAFPDLTERIVVVHEAAEVMPEAQPASTLSHWGVAAPYVLAVGSIEPRKNLHRLVEAFAALPEGLRHRTQLVVVGSAGWGGVDLPTLASRFGVGDQLRMLRGVDDGGLSTLYRHAHLLAMPSLYEGFGLPVLEALQQGTPVLVSDGSSLPEVAGAAGLCVNPLDVDAIARALRRMLEEDDLRQTLASRAVPQALRFSWERAAVETLAVFADAIERRRQLRKGRER